MLKDLHKTDSMTPIILMGYLNPVLQYGETFFHDAALAGADGLILVATGAGGHAGVQSPFALVQETRQWFDGQIALSG